MIWGNTVYSVIIEYEKQKNPKNIKYEENWTEWLLEEYLTYRDNNTMINAMYIFNYIFQ